MGQVGAIIKTIGLPAIMGAALVTMDSESAEAVPLPACNEPVNCLTFDDFTVYSLALLNFIDQSKDFSQPSSPGQINDAIIIGTGSGGQKNSTAGIDDPYDLPNNVPHNSFTNFESVTPTDPAPTFTGDNVINPLVDGKTVAGGDVWEATTEALRSKIDTGESVVFYFQLNETNTADTLNDGQDMLGWLQVTLTDLQNPLATKVFTLSGEGTLPGGSMASTDPLDFILPDNTKDLWAHVHGLICVDPNDPADPFEHFGSCTQDEKQNDGFKDVDQNLGVNQAAFALFNKELSDLILDPSSVYDIVSVDLRMSRVDNGFEQLFILGSEVEQVVPVPEPSSVAMFLAGLIGFAPILRRKRPG